MRMVEKRGSLNFIKKKEIYKFFLPIFISLCLLALLFVLYSLGSSFLFSGKAISEISSFNALSGQPVLEGWNGQYSQIQSQLIKGNRKITVTPETFDRLGLSSAKEIKEYLTDSRLKNVYSSDGNYILDIQQPETESFILEFSSVGINMRDLNSYIVELNQEPILEYAAKQSKTSKAIENINVQSKLYDAQVQQEHGLALQDIEKRLSEETLLEKTKRIMRGEEKENKSLRNVREFKKTFNGFSFKVQNNEDINKIKQSPYVKKIYPDSKVKAAMYDSVHMIGVYNVFKNKNLTGQGINIGIIDTGVDYTHPDLGGCLGEDCKVKGGYDFVNSDEDPKDDQGHGTHVAGTVAGGGNFEKTGKPSTFSFNLDQDMVYMSFQLQNFSVNRMPFLYGNGTSFLGLGKNEDNRMVVSSSRNITLKSNDFFALSANFYGNIETKFFYLSYVYTDASSTYVVLRDNEDKSYYFRDSINIGDVQINVLYANSYYGNTTLSINQGSFDTIFDVNNYSISFSAINKFPTPEISFMIKNSSNSDIGGYRFYWSNYEVGKVFADQRNPEIAFGIGDGIRGVAPNASIYAYKVLDYQGSGYMSDVVAGIEASADPNGDGDYSDHLDVISLSLGGSGDPDDACSQAIDNVVDLGVVAVVAAGNSGPSSESIGSPGTARKAITIGAIDKSRKIADFSSRGPVVWSGGMLIKPDLVAPGVNICSSEYGSWLSERRCLDSNHIAISGTSMATPHVSGVVALLKQARPSLTPLEIKNILKLSSEDLGYDVNTQGSGLINITKALGTNMVPSEIFINFGNAFGGKVNSSFALKNIGNSPITIRLSAQNISLNGNSYNVLNFSENTIVLAAGAEKNIVINLSVPSLIEGSFNSKIILSDNLGNNYTLYYSFSRLSYLNVIVEGDHYPNFYVHDENFTSYSGASQGWSFYGNNYTFSLTSGKKYVYVVNDFISGGFETDEYILSKPVVVIRDQSTTLSFNLANERQFNVMARAKDNVPLNLIEWTKGFSVYKNKYDSCSDYSYTNQSYCENNPLGALCYWSDSSCIDKSISTSFYDPTSGDRKIYLSNKPDSNFDYDILLKYIGVPEKI